MSDRLDTGDDRAPFWDRDYSQEFAVTLSWEEWNRLHSVFCRGIWKKEAEGWSDDELERDRELRGKLASEVGKASPGNGMDDWPDSMKKAYDETVMEMLEDE